MPGGGALRPRRGPRAARRPAGAGAGPPSSRSRLAASGLVERQPGAADRRRDVITVTGAGRRRLLELDERIAILEDELLAPLAAPERAQLTGLLQRLLDYHSGA